MNLSGPRLIYSSQSNTSSSFTFQNNNEKYLTESLCRFFFAFFLSTFLADDIVTPLYKCRLTNLLASGLCTIHEQSIMPGEFASLANSMSKLAIGSSQSSTITAICSTSSKLGTLNPTLARYFINSTGFTPLEIDKTR